MLWTSENGGVIISCSKNKKEGLLTDSQAILSYKNTFIRTTKYYIIDIKKILYHYSIHQYVYQLNNQRHLIDNA